MARYKNNDINIIGEKFFLSAYETVTDKSVLQFLEKMRCCHQSDCINGQAQVVLNGHVGQMKYSECEYG